MGTILAVGVQVCASVVVTVSRNRANSSGIHEGFGGFGDVRWAELGSSSNFISSSKRPSTALEAGRSKAKKGQIAGGRIEQRPISTGRPNPSNPGESHDTSTAGMERVNLGEQQQQGRVVDRAAEEELNSTWKELGLEERRAGGKFLPDKGATRKEATRVGGWGRDKSMQRVLSPEEQRTTRGGRRERVRSGVRLKAPTSGEPVVKKKKPKWDEGFDPDPRIRHPPEYYKYGPYGPHAWKGVTVGKIIKGTWSTNKVVYFSNVKDEAEDEGRQKYNITVDYTDAVAEFDPKVGIQYFYLFARRRMGPRPDPWEDWSLIAQLAVESGSDLGRGGNIFKKIGSKVQDLIIQCLAWARPDLTYVKRPKIHMRVEPQEDFLKELVNLLDPTKDGKDTDSFYGTLCRLVNVDIEASPMEVTEGFEALDEQGKMECMKHVFTNHPIQILSSERYERQRREQGRRVLSSEDGLADLPSDEETDDESNDEPLYDEEVDDQADHNADPYRNFEGSMESSGMEESDADRVERYGRSDDFTSEPRGSPKRDYRKPGKPGKPRQRLYYKPVVRSAVRPYSYSNIIHEIAEIRTMVSHAVHAPSSLI
ncbi:unnamed protein product [Calypogeia fissa]